MVAAASPQQNEWQGTVVGSCPAAATVTATRDKPVHSQRSSEHQVGVVVDDGRQQAGDGDDHDDVDDDDDDDDEMDAAAAFLDDLDSDSDSD